MRKVALICVGVAAVAAVLSGQGATPADGTMQALLAEVKGLRAELNRAAGASIRAQLLMGRLQLQEQRVVTASRQLEDVQREIFGLAQARVEMERGVKEEMESSDTPPEQRQDLERSLRHQLEQQQKREQELRQQESSLSALLAEEQARWTDFNSRLDELERALPGSRR